MSFFAPADPLMATVGTIALDRDAANARAAQETALRLDAELRLQSLEAEVLTTRRRSLELEQEVLVTRRRSLELQGVADQALASAQATETRVAGLAYERDLERSERLRAEHNAALDYNARVRAHDIATAESFARREAEAVATAERISRQFADQHYGAASAQATLATQQALADRAARLSSENWAAAAAADRLAATNQAHLATLDAYQARTAHADAERRAALNRSAALSATAHSTMLADEALRARTAQYGSEALARHWQTQSALAETQASHALRFANETAVLSPVFYRYPL
eukprot:NODE_2969_length_1077_cov_101.957198_g2723_i0.p1 GENE.NODE_2969_length_1077_cov_101.957198_g2723_i0~~NODE_2969_length_1077_cov_101.957198_g2723_i0.p1  ORF type:complete len:313 (+),score=59.98 NODE_2969_length_1077_cov_101.957198_g2723_i0:74-940(+)